MSEQMRWGGQFIQQRWWRVGLWVHFDFKTPCVSVCVLWWIIGFGRFVHYGPIKTYTVKQP